MRTLTLITLAAAAGLAGCGQTGPLVLPDTHPATDVVIRGPGTTPATATPAPKKRPADDSDTVPPRP